MTTVLPPLPFRGTPPNRDRHVLQQGFWFKAHRWSSRLDPAAWPPELDACPESIDRRWIDRRALFAIADRAGDPVGAIHTLVATSIWGTSTSARGRARRLRVFHADLAAVGDSVAHAVNVMLQDGPVAAYRTLHDRGPSVKHLGPAFGTKVLYFAGYNHTTEHPRPLILDRYVALALNQLCGWSWPDAGWTADQYATYLDLAERWAAAWDTEADVIELVLFNVGKSDKLAIAALSGTPAPEAP
ncbi:hypothetical protein FB474_0294 [Oryzihumus leptocrescens]|uniref:Uncharacterized protein n=1 Tax=Oryzihumus leptocrescens TaxID=297536 RepID=A0A542ZF68_9MICO|nr:hypothetical protein FB474_0294 [Oryzihumus leptocrescens]